MLRLRREIFEEAAKEGARIGTALTHPSSRWQEQPITSKKCCKGLVDRYQRVLRQQPVFGLHAYVGLKDREAAVQVMPSPTC